MRFGAKDVDVDADVVKGYEAVLAKNGKVLGLTGTDRVEAGVFTVRNVCYFGVLYYIQNSGQKST